MFNRPIRAFISFFFHFFTIHGGTSPNVVILASGLPAVYSEISYSCDYESALIPNNLLPPCNIMSSRMR